MKILHYYKYKDATIFFYTIYTDGHEEEYIDDEDFYEVMMQWVK